MIQLINLMILFVGCYIITKMLYFMFRDDLKTGGFGVLVIKFMAAVTIITTVVCIALALLSFVGTLNFDLERYMK